MAAPPAPPFDAAAYLKKRAESYDPTINYVIPAALPVLCFVICIVWATLRSIAEQLCGGSRATASATTSGSSRPRRATLPARIGNHLWRLWQGRRLLRWARFTDESPSDEFRARMQSAQQAMNKPARKGKGLATPGAVELALPPMIPAADIAALAAGKVGEEPVGRRPRLLTPCFENASGPTSHAEAARAAVARVAAGASRGRGGVPTTEPDAVKPAASAPAAASSPSSSPPESAGPPPLCTD